MIPQDSEPICLVSFEITRILLGGGPDSRPSFWKTYRQELELNQRTQYQNEHIRICRNQLVSLRTKPKETVYFRKGKLVPERVLEQ